MIPNQISEVLTQEKIDEVLGHVHAIHAALPFLVGLSPQQRMRMIKAGDASQGFIRKSLDLTPYVDSYLPRGMDVEEMRKDITLMDAMQPIVFAVTQLAEKLSDTHALVKSEAYSAALQVYDSAKRAQGPEGLGDLVTELARRFVRPARPGPDADVTPEAPEPEPLDMDA